LISVESANQEDISAGSSPRVSIIILNWNSYEVTRDCLLSLQKVGYPNYEVVLVDNGSVDGSPDKLAQEFPSVRLVRNATNLGFAGGNNVAIRDILARGSDYLLLLNNDTIVAPNFLEELLHAAESKPEIGLLNPKILYYDPADRIWYAGGSYKMGWSFARHCGVNRIDNGKYNQTREVSFVTGCALLAKAEVVRRVGLLDEMFFFGFEDLDWCVRAKKKGFSALYVPSAVIWHREGYVTKKNLGKPVKDFYYVKNSVILARKHLEARHWPLYALSLMRYLAYRTAGYAVRREPQRIRALYRGLWSGCNTKLRGNGGAGQAADPK
jgi:GT2 family glycosyltransferase